MSKRRVCLIWLLLIMVIICCSSHTSLGEEDDTLNISYPSSLPAKSEVSHEDILNHVERNIDRSISTINTIATVMGLLVGVMAIIVVIEGVSGYFKTRKFDEDIEQAMKSAAVAKKYEEEAKKAVENIDPIVEFMKEEQAKAKDILGEKTKKFPSHRLKSSSSLQEPLSEYQKEMLDEYEKKTKFLEAVGVSLESEDYFNRGQECFFRGRYREALKQFDKAIELKRDDFAAWNNKGVALVKLDRYEEALKVYDKAIKLNPDDDNLWYNRACAYSRKGDKENALKSLSKATDLDVKYKEMAKSDYDLKNLWDNEDFKRVVS